MEIISLSRMCVAIFRIYHERSLLYTGNKKIEKIYCDLRGKISSVFETVATRVA